MALIFESGTSLSQWQSLVVEAGDSIGIQLEEELESYLVFMLMRFLRRPDAASRIMALDYLDALYRQGRDSQLQLQEVGDRCLLVSGLFPKVAARRRVRVSYYVNMGRSAYYSLGRRKMDALFQKLTEQFVALMDILHAIRRLGQDDSLDAITACELWQDTGSQSARARLAEMCDATPFGGEFTSKRKH